MKQLIAVALVFSLALPAWPQVRPPPPPPDDDVPQLPREVPPVEETGYFESCFGVPRVASGPFGISGEIAIPIGGRSTDGSRSVPIPSGSSDEKAWLVAEVLAERIQTYPDNYTRFGALSRDPAPLDEPNKSSLVFGVGHVATDFQYDGAPRAVSAFSTHLVIRATPHDHVEGGLAIGYRRSVLRDRVQDGLEIGLPHRYALWRDGLRTVALEIRPLLLLGSGFEPSLEAAFLFPLAQVLHLRVGGRIYTFQGDLLWGLSGGLSLTL